MDGKEVGISARDKLDRMFWDDLKAKHNLSVIRRPGPIVTSSVGIEAAGILHNKFEGIVFDEETMQLLAQIQEDYKENASGPFRPDASFLFYAFMAPSIARLFPMAELRAYADFKEALFRTDRVQLGNEYEFSIGIQEGIGIVGTALVPHNVEGAILDEKWPLFPEGFQTLLHVHTHPPAYKKGRLLAPSTMNEKGWGDLGVFRNTWESFYGKQGWKGCARDFMQCIIQRDTIRNSIRLLLIQEDPDLVSLSDEAYISHIKEMAPYLWYARTQEEVGEVLSASGFRNAYIEIPASRFICYPILSKDDLVTLLSIFS